MTTSCCVASNQLLSAGNNALAYVNPYNLGLRPQLSELRASARPMASIFDPWVSTWLAALILHSDLSITSEHPSLVVIQAIAVKIEASLC